MNLLQAILIPSAHAAGSFSAGINTASIVAIAQGLPSLTIAQLASRATDWLGLFVTGLALLSLVWAGISYILAFGNEAGIAKAKKNIVYAVIGIMVAGSLTLIKNLIICRLLEADFEFFYTCPSTIDLAAGLLVMINLLLVPAGAMAFSAIIYGGYLFMISGGDESRAAKGKNVILYALVGLAVIGVSGIIVNVFINIL